MVFVFLSLFISNVWFLFGGLQKEYNQVLLLQHKLYFYLQSN